IAGFEWLATQNQTIKVVNLSWGSSNGLIYQPLINRLSQLGIVVVVSAGNVESGSEQGDEFKVNDPATAISSIAVGAVDSTGNNPASFSALGPSPNYIYKPDLVAPGISLSTTSDAGGIQSFTGTSGSAPLVSGAIATLISGLDDLNIEWNVGTIKAALMRTAKSLPSDELKVGQGLVDLNATWEYLMDAPQDINGPKVLEITPSSGPYHLFQDLPINIVGSIPISVITSHPSLVNIGITGTLEQILSYDQNMNSEYSQVVNLRVDTNNANGIYTGYINASLGNDFVLSEFTITLSSSAKSRVLLDLRHTNWDLARNDVLGGNNIGEMGKLAQGQNIWIHEVNEELTEDLLQNYDIIWMPDPFDISFDSISKVDPLLNREIDAIVNFVNNGGSLLIDFLGALEDQNGVFGTNSTEINRLISNFGILANSDPTDQLSESVANLHNVSSLVGDAIKITHFGNYLTLSESSLTIASNQFGVTMATYQSPAGGNVLVSSTNFWLDNVGVLGDYVGYGETDDSIISNNTWIWLTSDQKPQILSNIKNNTGHALNKNLHYKFHLYDYPTDLTETDVEVSLDGDDLNSAYYSIDDQLLEITIISSLITQQNHWYDLSIYVYNVTTSNSDRTSYNFYVGDEPLITSTSSFTASSTINTETTSASQTTTSTTKSSRRSFLYLSSLGFTMISIILIYRIYRKKQNIN
ncbi:MAG: S8 family peptidase, partial [Candidatus Kariarchaeaceae archaeon]